MALGRNFATVFQAGFPGKPRSRWRFSVAINLQNQRLTNPHFAVSQMTFLIFMSIQRFPNPHLTINQAAFCGFPYHNLRFPAQKQIRFQRFSTTNVENRYRLTAAKFLPSATVVLFLILQVKTQ